MKYLLPVLLSFVILCMTVTPARAAEGSAWVASTPGVRRSAQPASYGDTFTPPRPCTVQSVNVYGYGSGRVCLSHMQGWRFGEYQYRRMTLGVEQVDTFFVIGIGLDSQLYRLNGLPANGSVHSGAGSAVIVESCCKILAGDTLSIYPNLLRAIRRTTDGYVLTGAPLTAHYTDGTPVHGLGMVISPNGAYAAAQTGTGIALIDTSTGLARTVSTFMAGQSTALMPPMQLAVSNDGAEIFVSGRLYASRSFEVIAPDSACGSDAPALDPSDDCPTQDLSDMFNDSVLPSGFATNLRISSDGKRLNLVIDGQGKGYMRALLYPGGMNPPDVQYLALGDSYSSGEGDTGRDPVSGQKYYLPHTDDPDGGLLSENCHLSQRSYPFILGLNAGLSETEFHSVACSGAQTRDIVAGGSYDGQSDRLSVLDPFARQHYQADALTSFIPGRVTQQDFVDRYDPRAVTISIGGNDLQFAKIVSACVYSVTTCSYAADPDQRRMLGTAIHDIYGTLGNTYAALLARNPGLKLYVVGYPRFVNEGSMACPASTNLDLQERQMIDTSTRYFNQVIKAAAQSAGATYVDIEDSLIGHRICDDPGDYVNAIALFGQERAETFHPNAGGQAAMAWSIEHGLGTADLAGYDACATGADCCGSATDPDVPAYFADGTTNPPFLAVPSELLPTDRLMKGVTYTLDVASGLIAPITDAKVELHSDHTDLGTFTTDESGELQTTITIPRSATAGFHTVHAYASTPSGEPVDLYMIVFVADDSPPASMPSTIEDRPTEPKGDGASQSRQQNSTDTKTGRASAHLALPDTSGNRLLLFGSFAATMLGIVLIVVGRVFRTRRSSL